MSLTDDLDIKTADDVLKEQLGGELLENVTEEENTETASEENTEVSNIDVPLIEDDNEEEQPEAKPKKKFPLQVPVIISAVIVIGSLLAYFIFTGFFLRQPQGLWKVEDEEGVTYYYEFNDDGSSVMTLGTIDFTGNYSKSESDDGEKLLINQYYGILSGEYTYSITGNNILGNRVMTLTSSDKSFTLTQVKEKENPLTVDENFTADEKLLGEWEFTIPDYQMSYRLNFADDGTMVMNQYDAYIYNCVYTADGSEIEFKFFTTEEVTEKLEYSIDGDTLSFMGITWTRPGAESTADEA